MNSRQEKINQLEQLLLTVRAMGNKQKELEILSMIGPAYDELGNKQKAIEIYDRAIVLSRAIGDRGNEGINAYNKAMAICESASSSDIESREKALQAAWPIVQALKSANHPNADQMLSGLNQTSLMVHGVKQLMSGNVNDSIKTFEQALGIYKNINDKSGELQALINLGSAYEMLGRLDTITVAIENRLEAVKIAIEMGNKATQCDMLFSLGNLYEKLIGAKIPMFAPHLGMMWYDPSSFSQGVAQLAKSYIDKSIMIAREIGDKEREATSLAHAGLLFNHLGDRDQAIKCLETSINMLGNRDPRTKSLKNILGQMKPEKKWWQFQKR